MKNFRYVFKKHGIKITNAIKDYHAMVIEIQKESTTIEMIKDLEWIKGCDGHVYKLEIIRTNDKNNNSEIHLIFIYLDLNEANVERI